MPVGRDRGELTGDGGEAPGERERLPEERGCRSGYEYARKHGELWRGQSVVELRAIERTFMEVYRREGNGNSLGIALYLRRLLKDKSGRRKGRE